MDWWSSKLSTATAVRGGSVEFNSPFVEIENITEKTFGQNIRGVSSLIDERRGCEWGGHRVWESYCSLSCYQNWGHHRENEYQRVKWKMKKEKKEVEENNATILLF